MPAYQIVIGPRAYTGHYHSMANAVFGAMRKRENELFDEIYADQLPFADRSDNDTKIIRGRVAQVHTILNRRTVIMVQVTHEKVPKKIQRVR